MNGIHHTKSKRQIYYERVTKLTLLAFLVGVLCGIGTYKVFHTCEIPTIKAVSKATTVPIPTTTTTDKPTNKPTVKPKATKAPVTTLTPTSNENNLRSLGKFKLTAYCPCSKCCGKWASGITASGKTARANHTIAADTSVLPFGTEVYIDGQKYVVEDRGGAIKGNKIDIYFDSHTEANNFGVKYKEVFIS